jgi:hypothetical protein
MWVCFVRGDGASSIHSLAGGVCGEGGLHGPASSGRSTIPLYAPRDPRRTDSFSWSHFPYAGTEPLCDPKEQQINPGRRPDHNLDRNGVDDGTGATAAIGATDIRPDGNNGNAGRRSNRVCIVGIRGQFEC